MSPLEAACSQAYYGAYHSAITDLTSEVSERFATFWAEHGQKIAAAFQFAVEGTRIHQADRTGDHWYSIVLPHDGTVPPSAAALSRWHCASASCPTRYPVEAPSAPGCYTCGKPMVKL